MNHRQVHRQLAAVSWQIAIPARSVASMAVVWIDPPGLTSIGGKARGIADTVTDAKNNLSAAQADSSDMAINGLATRTQLDLMLENWGDATGGLAQNVRSTGDVLVSTANIYSAGDGSGADLFEQVPELPYSQQPQ
jgi:hypothetical protein